MPTGGKRVGSGRPPGAPNKLTVRRVEEVVRSGKRPPAENLRVISERAMAMAAHYQPNVIDEKTGEKKTNRHFNEERYAYWLTSAREANSHYMPGSSH